MNAAADDEDVVGRRGESFEVAWAHAIRIFIL
jgi:hypothetical protein